MPREYTIRHETMPNGTPIRRGNYRINDPQTQARRELAKSGGLEPTNVRDAITGSFSGAVGLPADVVYLGKDLFTWWKNGWEGEAPWTARRDPGFMTTEWWGKVLGADIESKDFFLGQFFDPGSIGKILARGPTKIGMHAGTSYAQLSGPEFAHLRDANQMLKEKKSMAQIWSETGWILDPSDGLWKIEWPHWNADVDLDKLMYQGGAREFIHLDEFYNDPELFRLYPYLKKLRVGLIDDPDRWGSSQARIQTIWVNPNRSRQGVIGTISHEIQHIIQDIENFSTGGSPLTRKGGKTWEATIGERLRQTEDDIANIIWARRHFEEAFDYGSKNTYNNAIIDWNDRLDWARKNVAGSDEAADTFYKYFKNPINRAFYAGQKGDGDTMVTLMSQAGLSETLLRQRKDLLEAIWAGRKGSGSDIGSVNEHLKRMFEGHYTNLAGEAEARLAAERYRQSLDNPLYLDTIDPIQAKRDMLAAEGLGTVEELEYIDPLKTVESLFYRAGKLKEGLRVQSDILNTTDDPVFIAAVKKAEIPLYFRYPVPVPNPIPGGP